MGLHYKTLIFENTNDLKNIFFAGFLFLQIRKFNETPTFPILPSDSIHKYKLFHCEIESKLLIFQTTSIIGMKQIFTDGECLMKCLWAKNFVFHFRNEYLYFISLDIKHYIWQQ